MEPAKETEFPNKDGTNIMNMLAASPSRKIAHKPSNGKKRLESNPLSAIKEESMTEGRSKELPNPLEAGSEEKKDMMSIPQPSQADAKAPGQSDKEASERGEEKQGILEIPAAEKVEEAEKLEPAVDVNDEEDKEKDSTSTKFDSVLLPLVFSYYDMWLDHTSEKPPQGRHERPFYETPRRVNKPDIVLKWVNTVEASITHWGIVPTNETVQKLLKQLKNARKKLDKIIRDTEDQQKSALYLGNIQEIKREQEQEIADIVSSIRSFVTTSREEAQEAYRNLLGKTPTAADINDFVPLAKRLIDPLDTYLTYLNEKPDTAEKINIALFLVLGYDRRTFVRVFLENFYLQFDEDNTKEIEINEFTRCINFIATRVKDKPLMTRMFTLMDVPMDSAALQLVNSGTVTGAEFDVQIYRKAFLKMRAFLKDDNNDHVTFAKFFPFLCCFFVAFEVGAVLSRKKLYENFKAWIVEAFRNIGIEEQKEKTLASMAVPQANRNPTMKFPAIGRNPTGNLLDKDAGKLAGDGTESSVTSFTYQQISRALTLLQAHHHNYFGNEEFYRISQELQKLLDVDPITLKSKHKVRLSTGKTRRKPFLEWANNPTNEDFSLERFLSLRLSELAMDKALSETEGRKDWSMERERVLFLYNELCLLKDSHSVHTPIIVLTVSQLDEDIASFIKTRLVEPIKKLYKGFDEMDGLLVVLHYMGIKNPKLPQPTSKDTEGKANETLEKPDVPALPFKISASDQSKIAADINTLLEKAAKDRIIATYLKIMLNIEFKPSYPKAPEEGKQNQADPAMSLHLNSSRQFLEDAKKVPRPSPEPSRPKLSGRSSVVQNDSAASQIANCSAATSKEVRQPIRKEMQKRKPYFPKQPTIFDGFQLQSKKKKNAQKYTSSVGLKFFKKEDRVAPPKEEHQPKQCTLQ